MPLLALEKVARGVQHRALLAASVSGTCSTSMTSRHSHSPLICSSLVISEVTGALWFCLELGLLSKEERSDPPHPHTYYSVILSERPLARPLCISVVTRSLLTTVGTPPPRTLPAVMRAAATITQIFRIIVMEIKRRKVERLERPNLWRRDPKARVYYPDHRKNMFDYVWEQRARDDIKIKVKYGSMELRFETIGQNQCLGIYTKRAVLKASAAVISVVSYIDEKKIFHGSGNIIETDGSTSASLIGCPTDKNVVTDNVKVVVYLSDGNFCDAQLLAYDHYNLAAIKIRSDVALPNATLRLIDDSISIDCNELGLLKEKSFQFRTHSDSFNLIPGDPVIVLGRYFIKPYYIMAAPGEFSANCCDEYDCQEFFKVECRITWVMRRSPADSAGILPDDVIVRCGGKAVHSFLEFFEIMWGNVGVLVELVVTRPTAG